MKVRVLYVHPHDKHLKSGVVYDLADGKHFVSAGDAEEAPEGAKAEADPRPAPPEEPKATQAEPKPRQAPAARAKPQPSAQAKAKPAPKTTAKKA